MSHPDFLPSIALELFERALQSKKVGNSCNTIILCAASFEAFLNEYLEFIENLLKFDELKMNENKKRYVVNLRTVNEKEKVFFENLKKDEEERNNIFIKLETIKINCGGKSWEKGEKIYNDFKILINIRNDIMHPRSKMINFDQLQRINSLKPLYQNRKIRFNERSGQSWLEAIDTVEFSEWCINTYKRMFITVLQVMITAENLNNSYVGKSITSMFAEHYLHELNNSCKIDKLV